MPTDKYETVSSIAMFAPMSKTAENVVRNCIGLRKNESLLVILRLARGQKFTGEGFAIAEAFVRAAHKGGSRASVVFAETRSDPNQPSDPLMNLLEFSWGANETVEPFRKMVKSLGVPFYGPPDAFVIVSGDGYSGKDVFGHSHGYPIRGSKEKWNSGFSLINKFSWSDQTKIDLRRPKSRTVLTKAMPLGRLARCAGVDYASLARRTRRLFEIIAASETVRVTSGPVRINGKTVANDMSFRVRRSWVKRDDGDCRRAGEFLNVPAGEVFLTPLSCEGVFIADGSIHLDNSYLLKKPLAIFVKEGRFVGFEGEKKMLSLIGRHLGRSRTVLRSLAKGGAVTKKTLKEYEDNFTKIGELGIGTNPRATLSEFLIEAEKIAGTVHMALGSGYASGRNSVHHDDAVAGSRLKIDVSADGIQIIRKNKLIV